MSRGLVFAALLSMGCNGALVKEKTAEFPTLIEAGPNQWVAFFGVTVTTNDAGRDLRTEVEMNVGGFTEEGVTAGAEFVDGFLSPLPTEEPGAHTGDVAIQHEPNFRSCDGVGYTVLEDAGCEFSFLAIATLSANTGLPRVGFIARGFETDAFTGTAEDVALSLVVEEAE